MNVIKDTPKNPAKAEYIAFVHARVAQDSTARGATAVEYDVQARKLFVYAFSLPFWAAMPAVLSDDAFYDLLRFVTAQDQVVVPNSFFDAFVATRYQK